MKLFLYLVSFLSFSWADVSFADAPQTIQFWHSMSGSPQEKLNKIIQKFNDSQNEVRVNAVLKGNYTESLNALVAAYRGGKQPHLTQVFEVGTQSMMLSGAILPVEDLFVKNGFTLQKKDFLEPIFNYYSNIEGKLISMPFNSSTPIVYYNEELTKKLGIKKIPETWNELFASAKEIHDKSGLCGLVFGWQSWTLIENFAAINNIALAEPENGFKGLDVKMNLKNPEIVQNISRIAEAIQKKEFIFQGRRSEAPRVAFLTGKCVYFIDSSSSIGTLKKVAKFPWGTAFQPYIHSKKPSNSLIGGASLWVMKGHSDKEYKALAQFLNFLTKPEIQAEWHQGTGYLPITYSAYKLSTNEGFYLKNPQQETAVKQLLRGPISTNSRGIRLGNFSQIREVIEENLEKIWSARVSAQKGMEDADKGANLILKRFEKLRSENGKGAKP